MAVIITSVNNGVPIGTDPVEFIGSGFGTTIGSVGLLAADAYFEFTNVTTWTDSRVVATPPAGIPQGVQYFASITVAAEDPPDPLGNAAFKDAVTNSQDTTTGRLMVTGSGGANSDGNNAHAFIGGNLDFFTKGGMWRMEQVNVAGSVYDGWLTVINRGSGSDYTLQRFEAGFLSVSQPIDPATDIGWAFERTQENGTWTPWRQIADDRIQSGGTSHVGTWQGSDTYRVDLTSQNTGQAKTLAPILEPQYALVSFSGSTDANANTKINFTVRSGSPTSTVALKRQDGSDLQTGDIVSGVYYWIINAKGGGSPEFRMIGVGGSGGGTWNIGLTNRANVINTRGYTYIWCPDTTNAQDGATAIAAGIANGQVVPLPPSKGRVVNAIFIKAGAAATGTGSKDPTTITGNLKFWTLERSTWTQFGTFDVLVANPADVKINNDLSGSANNISMSLESLSVAVPDDKAWGVTFEPVTGDATKLNALGRYTVGIVGQQP